MPLTINPESLLQIAQATEPASAPAREPEVWDKRIRTFNPLFAHTPEPSPVAVSPEFAAGSFNITEYLAQERGKDLLRFSTAGSVDDGKSTLIGRLLYDTQSVYDDQLQSIEGKGTTVPGVLDLALLTDGLRAEREQGITIDVAYRYFSTPRRKFIIADTPGHEQYTRNMATGASTADVAIVLIDARKGVLPQSRRHAYITALLGVRHVIVAVNKMDLVGYSQPVFARINEAFSSFFSQLEIAGIEAARLYFVPVSALVGDNVVHSSTAMPWYTGPALLDLLESIPVAEQASGTPFRMAVQRVVRPNLDFRGFAGQIAAGTIRPGDRVIALPSGRGSRVGRIVTLDGDLEQASAPMSVTLTLEDEIDISRGDLLSAPEQPAHVTSALTASLVWMDATPLDPARRYLLKHTSRTVQAQVRRVLHTVNLADLSELQQTGSATLALNDIGLVALETLLPLAVDLYSDNRHTGSFVLIDPQTNATVAAGMIRQTMAPVQTTKSRGQVTAEERFKRFGHTGAHVQLNGPTAFGEALERALFNLGANVVLAEQDAVPTLVQAGLLTLTLEPTSASGSQELWVGISGVATQVTQGNKEALENAVTAALRLLCDAGILRQGKEHVD